jgi:hypothetical protein
MRPLASVRGRKARWWGYSVTHSMFLLLVGDNSDANNIAVCLIGCEFLSGPTSWPYQTLSARVIGASSADTCGHVAINDEAVGFRAEARSMCWGQGVDPLTDPGWFSWGKNP